MNKELSFGQIIKEHRRLHDLTQAELARRVGCAAITIRKIEAGALRPSVQIAERLAMVLNIPLEERAAFIRLGRMAALFLGLVLLSATVPKVADPVALQELIEHEGLDFLIPSHLMVYLVLVIEGGIGLALVLGIRRLWVQIPACVLVALFVYLTGKTYIQSLAGDIDPQSSCGCFGNLVERSPAEAFWPARWTARAPGGGWSCHSSADPCTFRSDPPHWPNAGARRSCWGPRGDCPTGRPA